MRAVQVARYQGRNVKVVDLPAVACRWLRTLVMVGLLVPAMALAVECDAREGCLVDSRNGHFSVQLTPATGDTPLRQHHDWFVEVSDTDGKPVELDGLSVSGGMPGHGHGLPSQPRPEEYLGNGRYRVSGFLFNMHGNWVIQFHLVKGNTQDIAEITLPLDY